MRNGEALVVAMLVMVIVSATAILLWSLTLRYRRRELQHKERLAALEKGAPLPALTEVERRAPWTPRSYLLHGMMWLFSGIGLTLFLLGLAANSYGPKTTEQRASEAQRLKDLGASEAMVFQVLNDQAPHGLMPGFSLIGLIPIGVGLAYLIAYRAEKKNAVQRE
jgi:hypothetical protein